MAKAPYYTTENVATQPALISSLREAIKAIENDAPKELMQELWRAFGEVEESLKATVPIKRHVRVGFGVSKEKKAIACDAIISVVRQIKASKAW